MTNNTYQIKIELRDFEPKIWRRVLVSSSLNLENFHRIIQTVMGWTNSHLHQFTANNITYAPKEFELEDSKNSSRVKLQTLLKKEKDKLLYVYDFGDNWEHDIILEKILIDETESKIPVCIEGKQNCPPEDCGGTDGYKELIDIISNPKHEEYDSMINWLDDEFDPKYFNIDEININLKKKDYGCMWFL